MADYFVIDGRDGDAYVSRMSKKELISWLQSEYDGQFVSNIEDSEQVCHFGDDAILVIRGSLVVPAAKEAVTVWEVD